MLVRCRVELSCDGKVLVEYRVVIVEYTCKHSCCSYDYKMGK